MISDFISALFGILLGISLTLQFYTLPKAIEHGCGEYNKTTSDFQWIDRSKR